MDLSPEQRLLINNRVAADSPSTAAAYSLWLVLGLFGAHRFYLKCVKSGLAMLTAAVGGLCLAGAGIAVGGTPLDGIFYQPSVSDILRAAQTARGLALFSGGCAIFAAVALWWAADGFFIRRCLARRRASERQKLIAFYQNY